MLLFVAGVTVFPSTAPTRAAVPVAVADPGFVAPYAPATPSDGASGPSAAPTASGPAPASQAAAAPQASSGTATKAGSATALKAGDTSHCISGRQFDPSIDYFAPPCVPTSNGTNPGATYQGVTGSTITLVDYYPMGNSAVDTQLKLEGLYVSIADQRAWDSAVATFINSHYELYGRTVDIVVWQGTCSTIPPDDTCLDNEMNTIVATDHPFMVRWITP